MVRDNVSGFVGQNPGKLRLVVRREKQAGVHVHVRPRGRERIDRLGVVNYLQLPVQIRSFFRSELKDAVADILNVSGNRRILNVADVLVLLELLFDLLAELFFVRVGNQRLGGKRFGLNPLLGRTGDKRQGPDCQAQPLWFANHHHV